jgi:hypothetical protein
MVCTKRPRPFFHLANFLSLCITTNCTLRRWGILHGYWRLNKGKLHAEEQRAELTWAH